MSTCDVVVALIGPTWTDEPKLQDPHDQVWREIKMAMQTNKTNYL
jgi:hypothetical protein